MGGCVGWFLVSLFGWYSGAMRSRDLCAAFVFRGVVCNGRRTRTVASSSCHEKKPGLSRQTITYRISVTSHGASGSRRTSSSYNHYRERVRPKDSRMGSGFPHFFIIIILYLSQMICMFGVFRYSYCLPTWHLKGGPLLWSSHIQILLKTLIKIS